MWGGGRGRGREEVGGRAGGRTPDSRTLSFIPGMGGGVSGIG